MAACHSLFSLRMIRTLLERQRIPFELQVGDQRLPADSPVDEVSGRTPSIIAMVDSFSELPKELQEYLLSVDHKPQATSDGAKGLIIGGKGARSGESPRTRSGGKSKK